MIRENGHLVEIQRTGKRIRLSDPNMRILYVVDGSCTMSIGNHPQTAKKAQCLLVNPLEECRMMQEDHLILAVITIDYYDLSNYFQTEVVKFSFDATAASAGKYREFLTLLQDYLKCYTSPGKKEYFKLSGLYYLLLHNLCFYFSLPENKNCLDKDNLIGKEMVHYVRTNYKSSLSLNEIAGHFHVSASTASRCFQKTTGVNFSTYLNGIRMDATLQMLLNTDMPITAIAMKNGFSTPSTYNRSFRAQYGMTPTEYRTLYNQPAANEVTAKTLREVSRILEQEKDITDEDETITIRCDLKSAKHLNHCKNNILSVGPLYILSSANMQEQILYLVRYLHIEYLHLWNPFSRAVMSYDGCDYNFSVLDEIFDFCVDHDLKIMLDMAQRQDIAMSKENLEINRFDNEIHFCDAAEWEQTLAAFLGHILWRYGQDTVGAWIYEFTFFLNDRPYYDGGRSSARKVWESGSSLVRKYIPNAKTAGPGLPANEDKEFSKLLVESFLQTVNPPDYFTMYSFPYESVKDEGGLLSDTHNYRKIYHEDVLQGQVRAVKEFVSAAGFTGELWVTDWGFSFANRNYLQDSCFRAAYYLRNYYDLAELAEGLGLFYASDLLNVYSDTKTLLFGGGGILSRNGIRKPVFYAIEYLRLLGRNVVLRNENCILTLQSEREIALLCFNCVMSPAAYYLMEENSLSAEECLQMFHGSGILHLDFLLRTSFEDGPYRLRQRILNTHTGSILDHWACFDCSDELSKSEIDFLQATTVPEYLIETLTSINHTLRFTITMEPNEIRYITISRE